MSFERLQFERLQPPRTASVVLQAASAHAPAQRASARFSSAAAAAETAAAAAPPAGGPSPAAAAAPGMQRATDAQSVPQAAAGTGPVAGSEAPAAQPLPPPPPRNTKIRCWGCCDVADFLARFSCCPQRSLVAQTVGPDLAALEQEWRGFCAHAAQLRRLHGPGLLQIRDARPLAARGSPLNVCQCSRCPWTSDTLLMEPHFRMQERQLRQGQSASFVKKPSSRSASAGAVPAGGAAVSLRSSAAPTWASRSLINLLTGQQDPGACAEDTAAYASESLAVMRSLQCGQVTRSWGAC